MIFREYFRLAIRNIKARTLRSWLTVLGIIVGVFLVSGLFSLSEGMKEAVMRELRMMGGDIIMVMPGDMTDMVTMLIGGMEFSDSDLRAIERTRGVDVIVPFTWKAEMVRYEGESKNILISGLPVHEGTPILRDDMGWTTVEGEWISPGRREVLVGNLVPIELLPGLRAGDRIFISGRPYDVSGVLRSIGNRQDDSMIVMDLDEFYTVTGVRDGAQATMVKIGPGEDPQDVAQALRDNLEETRKRRGDADSPGFSVITADAAYEMVSAVIGIIQIVVVGLASIAIIVGALGIMNTMYTSVYERTKEIGILKAVGAKRRDIVSVFLLEAGMIGLAGGIGGLILGLGSVQFVELYAQFHPLFYFEAYISVYLILFSLFFAILVGCLSGFLPALRAANLNPVDSLRSE